MGVAENSLIFKTGHLIARFETRKQGSRTGTLPDIDQSISVLKNPQLVRETRQPLAEAMIRGMTLPELSALPTHQQQPLVRLMADQPYDYGGSRDALLRAIGSEPTMIEQDAARIEAFVSMVEKRPDISRARENWQNLDATSRLTTINQLINIHADVYGYQRPQLRQFHKARIPVGDGRHAYEYGSYESAGRSGVIGGLLRFNNDRNHTRNFDKSFECLTHELTHAHDSALQEKYLKGQLQADSPESKLIRRLQPDIFMGRSDLSQRVMAQDIPYEYQGTEMHAVTVAAAAIARLQNPGFDIRARLEAILKHADEPGALPVEPIRKIPANFAPERGLLSVTLEAIETDPASIQPLTDWRDRRVSRQQRANAPRPSLAPG